MILTIPYCNLATRPLVSLDIAWKDGQRNDVARNLKRLRKQMSKKWGDQSSAGKARPQFLADADVDVDSGEDSFDFDSAALVPFCRLSSPFIVDADAAESVFIFARSAALSPSVPPEASEEVFAFRVDDISVY